MSTNETTFIGALAFPGKTLSLRSVNIIFVEIYGHGGTVSVRDVPLFSLSFSNFQVDGNDQHFNYIREVSNPFAEHVNAPVITQTSYLQDQRVLKIEVGKYTGKRGKIITEILRN